MALATWFGNLVPVLDVLEADPQDIEDAIGEAMAPSDRTALDCFPLTNDGLAFTGEDDFMRLAIFEQHRYRHCSGPGRNGQQRQRCAPVGCHPQPRHARR